MYMAGEIGRNAAEYCATEGCQWESIQNSDQASNAIGGRSVGYNEETIQTDCGDRDGDAATDVRSDTQIQDQE